MGDSVGVEVTLGGAWGCEEAVRGEGGGGLRFGGGGF